MEQLLTGGDGKLQDAITFGHADIVNFLLDRGVTVDVSSDLLLDAIKTGNIDVVRVLLDHGLNAHTINEHNIIPAMPKINMDMIELLRKYGSKLRDINEIIDDLPLNDKRRVLYDAISQNNHKIVKLLLEYNEILNDETIMQDALSYAFVNGDLSIIKLLLENGARINNEYNILHDAVMAGHVDVVEFIFDHGTITIDPKSKLLIDVISTNNVDMARVLLEHGFDVHVNDDSAIIKAAEYDYNIDMIKLLLKYGANIHADDDAILYHASTHGNRKLVRWLLKNISYEQNHDIYELIAQTINHRHSYIAFLLLINGFNGRYPDDRALIYAAEYGYKYVVKKLLEQGADVHFQNDRALNESSVNGDYDIVKILLDYGADVHANDDAALLSAVEYDNIELTKLLLENGADIHTYDGVLLNHAVKNNNTSMVQLLLDYGADIHTNNEHALSLAINTRNLDMVNFLIEHGANYMKVDLSSIERFDWNPDAYDYIKDLQSKESIAKSSDQCVGITKSGAQCKKKPQKGNIYCNLHK